MSHQRRKPRYHWCAVYDPSPRRRLDPSQVLVHAPDGGLSVDSIASGEQVRAIATSRLGRLRGLLSSQALAHLDRALLIALDLPGQS